MVARAQGFDGLSNCYVFVVSGERDSASGFRATARDVLQRRLADRRWPLNPRTPHQRDLARGDDIAFYVAGADPEQSCFVGTGTITAPRIESDRPNGRPPSWLGLAAPKSYDVPVCRASLFAAPVRAVALVPSLEFVKNKRRWGTSFQGGIHRIPRNDFELIIRAAQPSRVSS